MYDPYHSSGHWVGAPTHGGLLKASNLAALAQQLGGCHYLMGGLMLLLWLLWATDPRVPLRFNYPRSRYALKLLAAHGYLLYKKHFQKPIRSARQVSLSYWKGPRSGPKDDQ